MAAASAVLRAGAERLEGQQAHPDFARLDAARDAVANALVQHLPDLRLWRCLWPVEFRYVLPGCAHRVARDLPRGVRRRPDPERRLQRDGHRVGARVGHQAPSREGVRDRRVRRRNGERSATRVNPEDIAALVSSASRVRRTAESLTALARIAHGDTRLNRCGHHLDRELAALQTWYSAFGFALMSGGALPPPQILDEEDARQLISCVRDATRGSGNAMADAALALLLASQHLDNLSHLETLLNERAAAIRTASDDGLALRKLRVLAS